MLSALRSPSMLQLLQLQWRLLLFRFLSCLKYKIHQDVNQQLIPPCPRLCKLHHECLIWLSNSFSLPNSAPQHCTVNPWCSKTNHPEFPAAIVHGKISDVECNLSILTQVPPLHPGLQGPHPSPGPGCPRPPASPLVVETQRFTPETGDGAQM